MTYPTSVVGAKTSINASRSSATVSHLLLGRVSTPPTAARARSTSLDISDRALWSHSTPCETAPTRSSCNSAADPTSWSSGYSIQHSATTKKKPSYKIAPCDEHSTSIKNTSLVKTHFWRTQPPLMTPRLSSTRRAALLQWAICCWVVSPHHPQQPGPEAHLLIFPTEHWQSTTEPLSTLWNSSYAKFLQFGSRSNFLIIRLQRLQHPTQCRHKKKHPSYKIAPCDEHSTSIKNTSLVKTHFWRTQPPLMAPRLSSTRCAALQQWATCGWVVSPHHPQLPGPEAHLLIFPTEHYGATQHLVKQLLREVLPIWQATQRPTGQRHATHRNHKTALIRQHWTM